MHTCPVEPTGALGGIVQRLQAEHGGGVQTRVALKGPWVRKPVGWAVRALGLGQTELPRRARGPERVH